MGKLLKRVRTAVRSVRARPGSRSRRSELSVFEKKSQRLWDAYPQYEIGRGTYGVPTIYDWDQGGTLTIGSFCSIGENVQMYVGGNHRMDCATTYPIHVFLGVGAVPGESTRMRGVSIGNDVWIASNAVILSGVTIGHGAVIGNSALVTKDVPPYAVVGGNPTEVIRYRFESGVISRLLEIAWWNWPDEEIEASVRQLTDPDIEVFLEYSERRDCRE